MLAAAREVTAYTQNISFEGYLRERMRQRTVERSVEIIGEAARLVSSQFRSAHPEIPWRPVFAQRHILAHEYGEILHEHMRSVAMVHIPELITRLEALLPSTAGD